MDYILFPFCSYDSLIDFKYEHVHEWTLYSRPLLIGYGSAAI